MARASNIDIDTVYDIPDAHETRTEALARSMAMDAESVLDAMANHSAATARGYAVQNDITSVRLTKAKHALTRERADIASLAMHQGARHRRRCDSIGARSPLLCAYVAFSQRAGPWRSIRCCSGRAHRLSLPFCRDSETPRRTTT
jgi:hypothetical protein